MALTLTSKIAGTIARAGHTFQLEQAVFTVDAMGGKIYSTTPSGSTLACWFQTATDQDGTFWGQRGIKITHKCYFSSDPGAKKGDVGLAGGDVASFLLAKRLVVNGFDDQGGLGQLIVLILEELKDGTGL